MIHALLGALFRRQARRAMRLRPSDGIARVPREPVFLYLHVPFCEVLCPYCTFHRVRFEEGRARRYFAALRDEIRRYHERGFRFGGLYVGGGTPTVQPGELAETLGLARELNPGLGEISVETNPKDLRPAVLDALAGAGVQRLSVGVQTLDDRLLAEMLRLDKYGSRAEILGHLQAAAGRFRTLNVDLIWDLPHQTQEMLAADLDAVLASPANQASFYPLMVSSSTRRRIARTLGAREGARMRRYYDLILDRMQPAFTPTSAWCFTRGGEGIDEYIVEAPGYVGLGSGAFSYLDGRMYATTFSVQDYVERIDRGLTGVTEERALSSRDALRYELLVGLMGLRLPKERVRERHGGRFERMLRAELLALRMAGAIADDGRAWSLTPRGRYLWVRMMGAFFESVDEFREAMRRVVRDDLGDTTAEVSLALLRRGGEAVEKGVDQVRAAG